ncbi:MAG: HNH endonuclease [Pseudonocardia sp.]|nr:HNH endonuclease [Pseudonocardia sp.]
MNEQKARRIVRDRSGGLCEVCSSAVGREWHHRKNRSQGGLWSPENGLHVCSPHHRWITEHPASSWIKGWSVRGSGDPAIAPVFMARYGYVLLTSDGGLIQTSRTAEAL